MTKFHISRTIVALSSWGLLGFYRGINHYDYHYEKSKSMDRQVHYLYSTKISYGFIGFFFYLNPIFVFAAVPKEIYRLEVNLRGLESEKNSEKYNEI